MISNSSAFRCTRQRYFAKRYYPRPNLDRENAKFGTRILSPIKFPVRSYIGRLLAGLILGLGFFGLSLIITKCPDSADISLHSRLLFSQLSPKI